MRDGVVLFRSHGGDPRTDRVERQVNPLGPLQQLGEGAGGGRRVDSDVLVAMASQIDTVRIDF